MVQKRLFGLLLIMMLATLQPIGTFAATYTIGDPAFNIEFDETVWKVFSKDEVTEDDTELKEFIKDYPLNFANIIEAFDEEGVEYLAIEETIVCLVMTMQYEENIDFAGVSEEELLETGKAFSDAADGADYRIYNGELKYIYLGDPEKEILGHETDRYFTGIGNVLYKFEFLSLDDSLTERDNQIIHDVLDHSTADVEGGSETWIDKVIYVAIASVIGFIFKKMDAFDKKNGAGKYPDEIAAMKEKRAPLEPAPEISGETTVLHSNMEAEPVIMQDPGTVQIINYDITKLECDAIVNAAKPSLLGGGGVDGAIHKAAGKGLLLECMKLGGCKTGEAKITKGYKLPCRYVIHTVGPKWKGGNKGEKELLENCYSNSLQLAYEYQCETVVFPLISSGEYGYPREEAMQVAVNTINTFLMNHSMNVYIAVLEDF